MNYTKSKATILIRIKMILNLNFYFTIFKCTSVLKTCFSALNRLKTYYFSSGHNHFDQQNLDCFLLLEHASTVLIIIVSTVAFITLAKRHQKLKFDSIYVNGF